MRKRSTFAVAVFLTGVALVGSLTFTTTGQEKTPSTNVNGKNGVAQLKPENELPRRAMFGAQLAPVTKEVRERQKLDGDSGVVLEKIFPDTSAAEDFKPGDVVLAVGGVKIADTSAFLKAIDGSRAGDVLTFEFVRDGVKAEKRVTLKEMPREKGDGYEVIYSAVTSHGARLRTIITRPKGDGRRPAVMLLQGGHTCFSVDNPVGTPFGFTWLARNLAKRGYVTMRIERPGCGDSEGGPLREVDFDTELDGYKQGLRALKNLEFVDPDNVILFGHSQGGINAPLMASDIPVRGIAVFGTVSGGGIEGMLGQRRRLAMLDGTNPVEVDAEVLAQARFWYPLLVEKKTPREIREHYPDLPKRVWDQWVTDDKYVAERHYTFYHQGADKNLAEAWTKVAAIRLPGGAPADAVHPRVLAIWGKSDWLVDRAGNAWIAEIVNRVRPGNGKFVEIDALDHFFLRTATPEESYRYFKPVKGLQPTEFHRGIVDTLCEWLDETTKNAKQVVPDKEAGVKDNGADQDSGWVRRSNACTLPVLETLAKYNPEAAGRYGLDRFDEAIFDLRPQAYERSREDIRQAIDRLLLLARDEQHPKVKQDLQLLVQVLSDSLASSDLRRRQLLPYFNVSEIAFEGRRALLNANVPKLRHEAALVRLKKYAGIAPDTKPIVDLAKAQTTERFDVAALIGPYRIQVQKDIAKSDSFVKGIADLMRDHGMEGWEEAHKAFAAQIQTYNDWLKSELLPRCRDDHRLPPDIYADNLKGFGVRMSPKELIERAQFGFQETRNEMAALAKRIAAERKWEKSGYKDVIAALKREQLNTDDILPRYRQRLKEIEEIIRREKIVSLPHRDARIRFASAGESARIPAPSMQPPRLIGNTGEYGEFLIPLRNPSAESNDKMDDFLHDAITWSLTAHEARPGHEMQFSAVVENGVSMARAVFAWNSANVEGWGLYSEAIMLEHLPLEGQFFTLYMRLLRAARAFLDPMVNQGQITTQEAKAFLLRELLLSEPMAAQEIDRYTFWMPGQAPSYYYGLMKLQALRAETELLLAGNFNQLAFHDFILAQGLLSLETLRQSVLEDFVPRHSKSG